MVSDEFYFDAGKEKTNLAYPRYPDNDVVEGQCVTLREITHDSVRLLRQS